jgi:predicted class III extradiol MEMO1 family dioxygenase/AMMECR1 domain-containing protein
MIPTPTDQEIYNLWKTYKTSFNQNIKLNSLKASRLANYSRIFFVPHADIQYSGYAALESYSTMIYKPTKVLIYGTQHNPLSDEDHSININLAIIKPLLDELCEITKVFSSKENINIDIKNIADFLTENNKNIVIFTSDMSHEYNMSSQDVLNKEELLVGAILDNQTNNAITQIKKISLCGPYNLELFLIITKKLNGYPLIRCYDDSKQRRLYWNDTKHDYIVSYLSVVCCMNNEYYKHYKYQFKCLLYKSYILSKIYNYNIKFPLSFQLKTSNGLFITILENKNVRACIGNFYKKGETIHNYIENIIPSLIIDAKFRWKKMFDEKDIGNLICEFTIMSNKIEQINPIEFVKNKNLQIKENGYAVNCNGLRGTFIPSVWLEHLDWSAEKYLNELLNKAGSPLCKNYELFTFRTLII